MNILVSIVGKYLGSKFAMVFFIKLAEMLVKRTDNTLDDDFVKAAKEAFEG